MAQIFVFGNVTADLQQQISTNGTGYVCFDIGEHIGYGEAQHTQFYQVWAWGQDAQRLVKKGVGKGSFIWITGSLELVDYIKKDGVTKDKKLKLILDNWGFVPGKRSNSETEATKEQKEQPVSAIFGQMKELDGEREALPE